MIERDWHNCYSGNWNGQITPDAFAHPAKFARGLIQRIYQYALEQGYLKPEDVVLDPFGGVSLGALDAISLGLNWVGVELEQPFNDLGTGCDCSGISKDDWICFYGRWDRVRYRNGRHWCPRCLSEAKRIDGPDDGQLSFLDVTPSAAYVRNSGQIPYTEPHHYTGNIELWGKNGYSGQAVLLQGDSRYLCDVLGEAGGVVSSPPYSGLQTKTGKTDETAWSDGRVRKIGASQLESDGYGTAPGQLGAMRVVSSPPYAESVGSDDPDKRGGLFRDEKRRNDKTLTAEYGQSTGQLGRMRVVSSPPWEGVEGANAAHKHKDPEAVAEKRSNDYASGKLKGNYASKEAILRALYRANDYTYGDTAGQLSQESGTDFWQAARQIMQQVAQVLPPGAVAIWVTKRFVRDKTIVEFSQQWAQLGEACGFETIEWIKAWLIEDRGKQWDLFGGLQEKQVKRASFFRRLYENKYPENAIDWEDVIIQRRLP